MLKDRLPTLALGGGLTLLGLLVLAALFVVSGLYNVSANKKHFDVTTMLLDVVRRQSVRTHTIGLQAPPLDDPDMVRLGAAHFESGCAFCHGAPGRPAHPLAGAMLPEPPRLPIAAVDWSSEQLFWIVREGQKYTGMPHWLAPEREDEIWSVVAFLEKLPLMEPETYEELATGGSDLHAENSDFGFAFGGDGELLANCSRCHGAAGEAPPTTLVPALSGQPQDYLERALREYAAGTRPSGIMQTVAGGLSETSIQRLAAYYAGGPPAPRSAVEADPAQLARGAEIYEAGIPDSDVPPCASCHGSETRPSVPRLAGLSTRYLRQQLQVMKQGLRDQSPFGAQMSVIAQRLTDEEVADVAAYLGSVGETTP